MGWHGVDLDGVLAYWDVNSNTETIGRPIDRMVRRVKRWLFEGKDVRIVTARVAVGESEDPHPAENQRTMINKWCNEHIGQTLPVTFKKDFQMLELWDDRAVQVIPNTGRTVEEMVRKAYEIGLRKGRESVNCNRKS